MQRFLTAALVLAASLGSAFAFDLQGHRGTRGHMPENTLPAFSRALEIGVSTLELDVGVTADGVVVISHDPYLNPAITRDDKGQWLEGSRGPLIHSLTLAQLQSYELGRIRPGTPYAQQFASQQPRDGTRMPTLASLFELVKARGASQVRFDIETKIDPRAPQDTVSPEAMTAALLKVIEEHGMAQRVTIQSFDWRTLQRVHKLAPGMPTSYLTIQTGNSNNVADPQWTAGLRLADYGSVPKMVKAAGGTIWSPNGGALTEALLKEAQGLGLKVIPWTVNSPAEIEKFIAWGVDGIISDYPDRVRTAMQARSMPLPPAIAAN